MSSGSAGSGRYGVGVSRSIHRPKSASSSFDSRASRSIRQRWTLLPSNSALWTSWAIGISTPWRAASASAASTVYAPSATPGSDRFDLGPRAAVRELLAEPVVTRQLRAARRDHVAEPREARERQRVRAGRDAEPGHLGEAAGHQAGLAVVAEPEAVRGARGDRDDVLERAAQLDAEHVRVRVQPELAPAEAGRRSARRAPGPRRRRPPTPAACARSPARGSGRTGRRSAPGRCRAASAMTSVIRSSVPTRGP